MDVVLEVRGLQVHYDEACAVDAVSLRVRAGQVLAVVGGTGAGKTTLLRAVMGLRRRTAGRVLLDGMDLTGFPAHVHEQVGMRLLPDSRRLDRDLSVQENLDRADTGGRRQLWDLPAVLALFPTIAEIRNRRAARLSPAESQMMAIGRALLASPRLLLLDELSRGLAPVVVRQVYAAVPDIAAKGVAVLLGEQDGRLALPIADDVVGLRGGRVVLESAASRVSPETLTAASLGGERSGWARV